MTDHKLINFGIGLFVIGFFPLLLPSISNFIMLYVHTDLPSLQFIFGTAIACGLACVVLGFRSREKP